MIKNYGGAVQIEIIFLTMQNINVFESTAQILRLFSKECRF